MTGLPEIEDESSFVPYLRSIEIVSAPNGEEIVLRIRSVPGDSWEIAESIREAVLAIISDVEENGPDFSKKEQAEVIKELKKENDWLTQLYKEQDD